MRLDNLMPSGIRCEAKDDIDALVGPAIEECYHFKKPTTTILLIIQNKKDLQERQCFKTDVASGSPQISL